MTIDELATRFDKFEEKNDDAHEQLAGQFDEVSREMGKLKQYVFLIAGVLIGTGALEVSKLIGIGA